MAHQVGNKALNQTPRILRTGLSREELGPRRAKDLVTNNLNYTGSNSGKEKKILSAFKFSRLFRGR